MLKKRAREGSDLSKQKLKKLKVNNSEEQSDINDSDIGISLYEFIGKHDCQNFICKLILPERDMTCEEKKLEVTNKLKNNKDICLNVNHKNLGKGQGGVLRINFCLKDDQPKQDFEGYSDYKTYQKPNKTSTTNIIDFMIDNGAINLKNNPVIDFKPVHTNNNSSIQETHLKKAFKEVTFDIDIAVNVVTYKVFTFTFNNVKLNEQQTLECNMTNDFYLKFFNKAENTSIIIDFKIKKNFRSIVNQDKESYGYIGIINEAMTCYMNSMLQTLNILGAFKKAVFQIPTNDQEDYNSVALSLQRLFYDLMKNTNPVSTNKLVKSFGWSKEDILIQHDVQEFNLHLSDVMKKKMKGTPGEGTFSNLFEGKLINYIECLNVSYKSEKIEHFCDLQLTVKVILWLIL
jgi:hypothetical protein